MNIEETVDFHLRSTLFAMRRMYNLLATENGITQGIGYALINIGKDGIPATKIAPIMGMTSSSLSRLLKEMETNGLIYRQHDDEDKRVVRIFLTKEGLNLREKVKEVVVNFNRSLFRKVSPEEINGFIKVNNAIKELVVAEVDEFQNNTHPK
ncbi:MAG: MarR family transcriptional regulator [Marinilabiliales bacterium]|nr:MAG: MarR family transcriptional regulator [Marinilabiliales bacterium]